MIDLRTLLESYIGTACKCKVFETNLKDLHNRDKVKNLNMMLSSACLLRDKYYNELEEQIYSLNRDELDLLLNTLKSQMKNYKINKNIEFGTPAYFRDVVCKEYYDHLHVVKENTFLKL